VTLKFQKRTYFRDRCHIIFQNSEIHVKAFVDFLGTGRLVWAGKLKIAALKELWLVVYGMTGVWSQ
jgi:hypothetical protein